MIQRRHCTKLTINNRAKLTTRELVIHVRGRQFTFQQPRKIDECIYSDGRDFCMKIAYSHTIRCFFGLDHGASLVSIG